ncbi:hypothetical protein I553_7365 [Mycobacterium xenopi 4042]|uniref:Uncharacterized protein n=1 Tax=Mycobacterium xenopi 4042 TaxID=1299334 RepID=X8E656_MYCXE|nr:hypothetical protein I553_7365 [Mycobacterium xenopi 4042]
MLDGTPRHLCPVGCDWEECKWRCSFRRYRRSKSWIPGAADVVGAGNTC